VLPKCIPSTSKNTIDGQNKTNLLEHISKNEENTYTANLNNFHDTFECRGTQFESKTKAISAITCKYGTRL